MEVAQCFEGGDLVVGVVGLVHGAQLFLEGVGVLDLVTAVAGGQAGAEALPAAG